MSSRPGAIVLDPMMGSGNSLVAARNLGRKGIGIEMQRRWCRKAVKRLARTMEEYALKGAGEPLEELPLFNGWQNGNGTCKAVNER